MRGEDSPIEWPAPWRAVHNEASDDELQAVWAYWRASCSGVAPTVAEELQREVSPQHCLSGVVCRLIAWNTNSEKDFAFTTDHPDAPLVIVHLTWYVETDPRIPFTWPYPTLEALMNRVTRNKTSQV